MADDRRYPLALTWRAALGAAAVAACARGETESAPRSAPTQTTASPGVSSAAPRASGVAPSAPASGLVARDAPAPAPSSHEARGLPPLASEATVSLPVTGFLPAVVSVPVGAKSPRPVAVALHGNFDRPEWQCGVWGPLVAARGFVVCPRGVARRDVPKELDRWEYSSGKAMAKEIDAALAALGERFGAHVDPGPILFIGFSLGAIYGASIVQAQPARFPRGVFIEGGLGAWSQAHAKRFAARGGQRLLLACGQGDCMGRVKGLAPQLERAGLPTRFGGEARAGHTYDGPVAAVVADNWEWLVEGDARWAQRSAAD